MYARFSAPDPWTRTIAGCLPPVDGAINVPANCTSRFVNRTSSRFSISTRFAVRGAAPSRCQVSETIRPALSR